jgi:stalled ribosome rescue protein Dom34
VKNETKRVVVWIDHATASVVHVEKDEAGVANAPANQLQRFSAEPASGEVANRHVRRQAKDFFRKVRRELKGAKRILIVGPSTAKLDFLRFIGKRSNAMESRVVGIETLDDRSDEHLLAYAKRYFDQSKAA